MPNQRQADALTLAELQYNRASATCLPAAKRALIAAIKASILAIDAVNHGSNVFDETWTMEELEAAKQVLHRQNFQPIAKDDTAIWDLMKHSDVPVMVFYVTPAYYWIPAIVKAASTRIKAIEERMGRAEARELFKPPFLVIITGHLSSSLMMVPELVRDMQPSRYVLGPVQADTGGLVPVRINK